MKTHCNNVSGDFRVPAHYDAESGEPLADRSTWTESETAAICPHSTVISMHCALQTFHAQSIKQGSSLNAH